MSKKSSEIVTVTESSILTRPPASMSAVSTPNVIAGHRGWIGADARTRLAEAERTRTDAEPLRENT